MSDAVSALQLPPAVARQIDQTCDRFEAGWKAGQRPDPAEFLGTVAEPARAALLRQLLLLDWEYRRRASDDPCVDDYITRFPGDTALIEDVSREMAAPAASALPDSGACFMSDLTADLGREIAIGPDRYELLQELGAGGIGVVYRGRDGLLGRELAVKVLRESYRDNRDARRRFVEEARVGSQLQHPAIVPVYELGWFHDRRPYITMKLVEGNTLAALLRDRTDPTRDLPQWMGIFEQVCRAVAYAHSRRVVHRDLKPANIMVGAFGEVQVMDWGFAKVLAEGAEELAAPGPVSGQAGASRSGLLMGTPAYMPPEQARGEAALIDRRTDVFALGAILCEILTGRPPYVADTADEICLMAATGDLADARARLDASGADEALRELATRCLAATRDERPPDAAAVVREVTAYLTSAQERLQRAELERAAAEARLQEAGAKAHAERRARRLTLALAAASAVVMALGVGGWVWRDRVRQAEAARVATTDTKVEAALASTIRYVSDTTPEWYIARDTVKHARGLVESGASDNWKARVDEAAADLDAAIEIDEARAIQASWDFAGRRYPRERALPRYAEAFAKFGVSVGDDPAAAAARVTARPAPVRDVLLTGLDNWWLLARRQGDPAHHWLGQVLQAADTDEWRPRIRRAVANGDRRALEELAKKQELGRRPSPTITSLTWAMLEFEAYDAVVALLQPAQLAYPRDYWINYDLAHALLARNPNDYAEPMRFFSIAATLRPGGYASNALCHLYVKQKNWDAVVTISREIIARAPNPDRVVGALVYNDLGLGLRGKGDAAGAETAFRKAIELDRDQVHAHANLGRLMFRERRLDQAVAELERAIELDRADLQDRVGVPRPDARYRREATAAHYWALGDARYSRTEYDAALAAYDKAIELNPGDAQAHNGRGMTLRLKNRIDEAIPAFEQAIRLDPQTDTAHFNLGLAWLAKGRPERAVAPLSRLVELDGTSAENHQILARALSRSGDPDRALASLRKAVEVDEKFWPAHWDLGRALAEQGQFAEALTKLELADQLGAVLPAGTAGEIKRVRRLVALNAKLPGILEETEKPASAAEQLEYAGVCRHKSLNLASARLYNSALTAEPALAISPVVPHRFHAACVAALAGTGQGRDAAKLAAADRARWRTLALDWLRIELTSWATLPDGTADERAACRGALERLRREKALAGVRELEELAKLPEVERTAWIRFWADVQELQVKCLAKPAGK